MATVGDHGGSAASSAQLNAALLAFQKATRDEERFASLLVLAKLGAADRPDVAARVSIWTRVSTYGSLLQRFYDMPMAAFIVCTLTQRQLQSTPHPHVGE